MKRYVERRSLTAAQEAQVAARKAQFHVLTERIAAMPEEERNALAASFHPTTPDGHALSARNAVLVYYQNPNATIVGGFRQWKAHDRYVKQGERGIQILAPRRRHR